MFVGLPPRFAASPWSKIEPGMLFREPPPVSFLLKLRGEIDVELRALFRDRWDWAAGSLPGLCRAFLISFQVFISPGK